MSLRPYPEYKASSVDWLDDIPAHWGITSLNRLAYIQPSNVDKHTKQGEIPVRLCNYTDVYKRTFIHNRIEFMQATATQSEIDKFTLKKGDVLITKDSEVWTDIAVPAYVTEELENVLCGYHLTHIRPYKGIVGEYIFRSFQALPIAYQFWISAKGVTRYGIDTYSVKSSIFLLPPPNEQDAIVHFLDVAEKHIRRYIRAKQKLIKLLNEQKQAIIQQAVTSGLNLDVPMKDSGVEWLGEIPAHWEVLRAKFLFREINNRSETGQETQLSMSQKYGLVPSHTISEWRLRSESYVGAKITEPNDLVLNRLKAHLGVFALNSQRGLVSPDYTVLRAIRPMVERYFELTLKTPACRLELKQRAKGIVEGFWRLYTDDFYEIPLPVPSIEEQDLIVKTLKHQLENIEYSINQITNEIDLIREYRTRLIADVVTGKMDVRGLAFEMPEEFDDDDLLDVDEDELLEEDELEEVIDGED